VVGAIIIVIALLLFPVAFLMSGAVGAAVLGGLLKRHADDAHAGSELIELNN
jgi:hypothetical protein